jgi:hypothetical protein
MREGLGESKTTAVCGVESLINAESGVRHDLVPKTSLILEGPGFSESFRCGWFDLLHFSVHISLKSIRSPNPATRERLGGLAKPATDKGAKECS